MPTALAVVRHPGTLVREAGVANLTGCRLIALDDEQDEQRWDHALSAGLPLYALADRFRVWGDSRAPSSSGLLMALAYGQVTAGDSELISEAR